MSETPPSALHSLSPGEAFAALILFARKRQGWTQDEVSTRSGVGLSTLKRWESGAATNPSVEHVRAVCSCLSVDSHDALVALGYLDAAPVAA